MRSTANKRRPPVTPRAVDQTVPTYLDNPKVEDDLPKVSTVAAEKQVKNVIREMSSEILVIRLRSSPEGDHVLS